MSSRVYDMRGWRRRLVLLLMSAVQLVTYGAVTVTDNQTRFLPASGALVSVTATESQSELPIRTAGTIDRLYAQVTANSATVNTTVTVRKSTADTAVTLTVSADATGEFEDTTNSVSFAATDEIDIEVTVPTEAGTNTITFSVVGVRFTPDSGTQVVLGALDSVGFSTASATQYFGVVAGTSTGTESGAEWSCQNSWTVSGLWVNVSANARTTNTVYKSRKNAADGAQSVTYGSTETGVKEDTTNSDSLASGDEFNLAITTGTGTGTITKTIHGVRIASSASQFPLLSMKPDGAGLAQATGVTNYMGFGALATVSTTESGTQLLTRFDFTAKNLTANVSANSIVAGNSTVRLRKNAADGNQVLTYATLETGVKTDATNTDALTSGTDRYNLQVIAGAASGTITLRSITMTGEVAAVTATQPCLVGPPFGLAAAHGLAA